MKKKIVLFSVLTVFALLAVIAVSSALADIPSSKIGDSAADKVGKHLEKDIPPSKIELGDSRVWFDPEDSSAEYCETVDVNVWIQTVVPSAGFSGEFDYTFCCANVTKFVGNYTNWDLWCEANLAPPGHVKIVAATLYSNPAHQPVHIGTLTIHCCDETSSCLTDLVWDICISYIEDEDGEEIMPVAWHDGTFACESQEKPDLVVVKSVTIEEGNFTVNYTVTNIGAALANASTTCKYVDGERKESQACPALGPGESHTGTFVSEPCPCGAILNVTACTDNDNVVDESDETNNCEVNIIQCPSTKVDIRADGIAGNIFDVTGYSICPGTVTEDGVTIGNETAMGALVIYCQNNGINIHITLGTWGEYVVQIGNDLADNNSWSYAVNEVVPPVGGAQKVIVDGDRVHWYNNNLQYYSVLTALDKTAIYVDETLTATVTWKNIAGIHLLNGASVHVGAMGPWGPDPGPSVGTTCVDGTCTFPWSTVGTWGVYAVDPVHGSGQYNWPYVSFTCSLKKPDLVVEKKWEIWMEEAARRYTVSYVILNNGTAIAPSGHNTTLYVDGVEVEHKQVPVDLAPGDNYTDTFDTVIVCTENFDTIKVCVDNVHVVYELNETNNCLQNVWPSHCPAEIAVYQADVPNADGILNALRTQRDNNLKDEYVDRYYDNSPELAKVIGCDSALTNEAARLLSKYSPMVSQDAHRIDVDTLITERDVDEIESFIDKFKESVLNTRDGINVESTEELIKFLDEFEKQVEASEGKTFSDALHDSIYYIKDEQLPDLMAEKSVTIEDGKFTVDYTVTNIGIGTAEESTTCKYVDGERKESQACPSLGSGESYNGIFVPEPCPCGATLNVTVCADNDDVVVESDETNNCEVNIVECPDEEKPDLVIEKKRKGEAGKNRYVVCYDITNIGTETALAGHHSSLYLDGKKTEHKLVPVDLAPGESYTATFDTVLKDTVESDTIRLCADSYDVVDELDEANNCVEYVWPPTPTSRPKQPKKIKPEREE